MSATTDQVPEECPGVESERAGKEKACGGCPNQENCATGKTGAAQSAEDVRAVRDRFPANARPILILSGKGGVGKVSSSKIFSLIISIFYFNILFQFFYFKYFIFILIFFH